MSTKMGGLNLNTKEGSAEESSSANMAICELPLLTTLIPPRYLLTLFFLLVFFRLPRTEELLCMYKYI